MLKKLEKNSPSDAPFDAAYYGRYYESERSRVYGAKEIGHLASGITGLIRWWEGRLETVLDVGAGAGLWRDWFKRNMPAVRYRSVEVSAYACERYGHEQHDISAWCDPNRFDLVICQGVLPYLTDRDCARAIDNLGKMTGGFLYLEAITKKDVRTVCDPEVTDARSGVVHGRTRTRDWYVKRLHRHVIHLGAGLHYAKRGHLRFYELERE